MAEIGKDGEEAAEMEKNVETGTATLHPEIVLQEGQVAGGGDGEEFGDTLDKAQKNGGKGMHTDRKYNMGRRSRQGERGMGSVDGL
jgi:hypothetical protein